jgi:hypothetical protein
VEIHAPDSSARSEAVDVIAAATIAAVAAAAADDPTGVVAAPVEARASNAGRAAAHSSAAIRAAIPDRHGVRN